MNGRAVRRHGATTTTLSGTPAEQERQERDVAYRVLNGLPEPAGALPPIGAHMLAAYADAEEDCTRGLALNPSYIKALSRRGMARQAMHRHKEAVHDFELALQMEPKNRELRALMKQSQARSSVKRN